MIRMTWRQHRVQWAAAAVALAALAAYLITDGVARADYAQNIGLTACLGGHGQCDALVTSFFDRFGATLPTGFFLLALLPLLAGLFWGAPLIAREVETGTHRLAWTQSVTRSRWIAVKLAAFTAAALLAAGAVSLLTTWWLRPLEAISQTGAGPTNRLAPTLFDLTGTAPLATTIFAFALGTAAGAVIRRTVPAMAVTVGAFLAAWMPIESLRYHFLAPLTITTPFGIGSPPIVPGSYPLSTGSADAAGHPIPFEQLVAACETPHGTETGLDVKCLAAHGFQHIETYQPDSRYWPLQGIETGIFLAAAIGLLALAVYWTRRRIS